MRALVIRDIRCHPTICSVSLSHVLRMLFPAIERGVSKNETEWDMRCDSTRARLNFQWLSDKNYCTYSTLPIVTQIDRAVCVLLFASQVIFAVDAHFSLFFWQWATSICMIYLRINSHTHEKAETTLPHSFMHIQHAGLPFDPLYSSINGALSSYDFLICHCHCNKTAFLQYKYYIIMNKHVPSSIDF